MPTGETYQERLGAVSEDLARLAKRLRGMSPRSLAARRGPAGSALTNLARISALAENRSAPAVLEVSDHVLADALDVVGSDVIETLAIRPNSEWLEEISAVIQVALERTR